MKDAKKETLTDLAKTISPAKSRRSFMTVLSPKIAQELLALRTAFRRREIRLTATDIFRRVVQPKLNLPINADTFRRFMHAEEGGPNE